MRASILAVLLAVLPTAARPQPMPLAPAMSCAQAALLVRSQGAIVLRTGPGSYDRYVSHAGHCLLAQKAEPAWVPSADTPQCFVGYRCVDTDNDDWPFRFPRR